MNSRPCCDYNQILYPKGKNKRDLDDLQLVKAVQSYSYLALDLTHQIIDDMLIAQRKFQPVLVYSDEGIQQLNQNIDPDDYIDNYDELYFENNIVFKIATTTTKKIKFDQKFFKFIEKVTDSFIIYSESKIKMLKNEFRYMDLLGSLIQKILKSDKLFKLRIPLACLIEYRGFIVLATAHSSMSYQNELFQAPQNINLIENMRQLGNFLNLKEYKLNLDGVQVDVVLSALCELRAVDQQEIYLIIKVGDLMPCDYTTEYESHKRIRQEFIKQYSRKLCADALLDLDQSKEGQQNDQSLKEAIKYMREHTIQDLIDQLNHVHDGILHKRQAALTFHEFGVSLRYIGQITTACINNFTIQSLQIEMTCRSIKKIYRNVQTQYFMTFKNKQQSMQNYDQYFLEKSNQFVQMILSTTKDSQIFWQSIIGKQIKYDYDYDLQMSDKLNWSKGQFIHFLEHHLNLRICTDIEVIFKNKLIKMTCENKSQNIQMISTMDMILIQQKNHLDFEEELCIKQIKIDDYLMSKIKYQICNLLYQESKYNDLIIHATKISPQTNEFHYFQINQKLMYSYLQLGQIHQARQLLDQIKYQSQKIWGEYNPILLSIQETFSLYYQDNGFLMEAESLHKLNLIQRMKSHGITHTKTATLFERLGDIQQNNRNQALEHYKQSCHIYDVIQPFCSNIKLNIANVNLKVSNLLIFNNEWKESMIYLIKSSTLFEKLSDTIEQQMICNHLMIQCLIKTEDYQKCQYVCDKLWLNMVEHSMDTPQRYDQLFQQGFIILCKKMPQHEKRQLLKQLDSIKFMPDSRIIFQYQKAYEKLHGMLKTSLSIISELGLVLKAISCQTGELDILPYNMILFIGHEFFYEQMKN